MNASFRLQRVRRIKERLEKKRKLELGAVLQEQEKRRRGLEEARQLLYDMNERAGEEMAAGISSERWNLVNAYLEWQEHNIRSRKAQVELLREPLQKARERLMEAGRERQAYDRLHERWREAFEREESRAERAQMDSIGLREAWQRLDHEKPGADRASGKTIGRKRAGR